MTTLTEDQRAILQRQLAEIDAVLDPLLAERAKAIRAAKVPFRERLDDLQAKREALLEEHGIDEPAGKCDFCGRLLLVGDKAHTVADDPGIMWCEVHSPTWAEQLAHFQELNALPDLADRDEEDVAHFAAGLAKCQAEVDAGNGNGKVVWELGQ